MMEMSQQKERIKAYFVAVVVLVAFLSVLFGERLTIIHSTAFSDYTSILCSAVKEYAVSNDGYYPKRGDVLKIQFKTVVVGKDDMFPGLPFEWAQRKYCVDDDENLMIAWNSKPYGIIRKWRGVVFVGGGVKLVSEKNFRKRLEEQQTAK